LQLVSAETHSVQGRTPAAQLETELSLKPRPRPMVILEPPAPGDFASGWPLPSVFSNYCGGSFDVPDADAGLTDRIHAMIAHMSASVLMTSPMGGIGPTTSSEPLRL
jgi:hypothetical protein